MASQTLTADGTIGFTLKKGTSLTTVLAYGTWGGGTAAFHVTRGGVNIPITDAAGTAITATANKAFNVNVGADDDNTRITVVLSGSVSPSLTFDVSGGRVL